MVSHIYSGELNDKMVPKRCSKNRVASIQFKDQSSELVFVLSNGINFLKTFCEEDYEQCMTINCL